MRGEAARDFATDRSPGGRLRAAFAGPFGQLTPRVCTRLQTDDRLRASGLMAEYLWVDDFAQRLGVSEAAVRKAIRTGRVTAVWKDRRTGRKRLAWPRAAEEWQANTDPLRRTHVGPRSGSAGAHRLDLDVRLKTASSGTGEGTPAGLSYAEARTRREAYEAQLAKLECEQKAGLLIPAAQVQAKAFKLGRQVRDALLNIPDRLAHELAGEDQVDRVKEILARELEVAIAPIASAVR